MRLKLFGGLIASIAGILLLGSAFLPTLCRSRETANRVKCASNLRQISQAIDAYADAHGGVLPDSFATLVRTGDLVPEVFVCPSSNAERADSIEVLASSPTAKNCTYTYLGEGLKKSDLNERVILMSEDIEDHDRDGINVIMGDRHVEFMMVHRRSPQPWFVALAEAAKSTTTRPVVISRSGSE